MSIANSKKLPPFTHIDLRIVTPEYGSDLTDHIMHLEYLRRLQLLGTTPVPTFFQIKSILHTLESIGSARIEGNRTTVIEYIDRKLEKRPHNPDSFREIENMERCLEFIDDNISERAIDRAFISELHKRAVSDLTEEGSKLPGEYRRSPVLIRNSSLIPPPFQTVTSYMDELFRFIAQKDAPKYDLIKTALAHHRFVWIHPFDNGNGRTVRLFTYAMMVKSGFNINLARILNPTAIFCHDREEYYAALSRADRGDDEGLLQWTAYMLKGLLRELEKTDRLADYDYLKREILAPTIDFSLEKNLLNHTEAKILRLVIEKKEVANADIKAIIPGKDISDISRMIRSLVEKNYLVPTEKNRRKYRISFRENKLIRGVIHSLDNAGFLPGSLGGSI